jgi:GAF domain-containing protein
MKLSIFSMNRSGADNPEGSGAAEQRGSPGQGGGGQQTGQNVLAELRGRILDRIYLAACTLGTLSVIANLPYLIGTKNWGLLAIYSAVVITSVTLAINKRASYNLRALVIIGLLLALGVSILINQGLYGSGRLFLVMMPLLATMLAGRRSRYLSLGIAVIVLPSIGALMLLGVIPMAELQPRISNAYPSAWLSAWVSFSLAAVTGVLSYGVLIEGLEKNIKTQNEITAELERERSALEARVQHRTASLERRLVQIRTAAEITRQISRVLDINQLLPQVCELVRERFGLYYVGIFLAEETPGGGPVYAVLSAGTGEAGKRMLAENHRLLIGGDSMVGWATSNRQARIAMDVGKEASRFNNPYLPRTRSELALPILAGTEQTDSRQPGSANQADISRVLGAMTVQSEEEAAFDQDDIVVLQGIADGLAAAIENARLFATTQASLEEVQALHRQYLEGAWQKASEAAGEMAYTYEPKQARASKGARAAHGAEETEANKRLEVPIRLREQVIGSLLLEGGEGQAGWSREQRGLVEAVTNQAALALENARLLEETRRRVEQERATSQITTQLWSSTDIDTILRTTLLALGDTLQVQEGWVELWPGGKGEGPTHRSAPTGAGQAAAAQQVAAQQAAAQQVARAEEDSMRGNKEAGDVVT